MTTKSPSENTYRNVEFTPELFERVKKTADADRRSFKAQAAYLIEMGLNCLEADQ